MAERTAPTARWRPHADSGAAALAGLGIAPGDRVALLTANRIEMVELFFACARLGAVQVPINTFLKGEFLRYQLADCGAETVVVDGPGLAAVAPLLDRLPAVRRIVTLDDAGSGEVIPYRDLTSGAKDLDLPVPQPDDLASIIYTSGTTGPPKGCLITQGYFVHIGDAWRGACDLNPDDVVFTAFPFFHLSGQALALMCCLTGGLSLYLEPAFSATAFMPRAREVGATATMGVGAMALAVLATPPAPEDRDHRIRYSMWIPLPPAKQLELEERFGAPVNAEGLRADGVRAGHVQPPDGQASPGDGRAARPLARRAHRRRRRRRGAPGRDRRDRRPAPRTRLAVQRATGAGRRRRCHTFRNLWHHTGDYGRMDDEGFVTLRRPQEGRPPASRGERVVHGAGAGDPASPEGGRGRRPRRALGRDRGRHQGLRRPRPRRRDDGPEELFAHFEAKLPYFAVPRYVELLPALPKNAIGRVLKHELRAAGVTPATWDLEALGLTVSRDARR